MSEDKKGEGINVAEIVSEGDKKGGNGLISYWDLQAIFLRNFP